jgi:hypothetical protein
MTHSRPGCDWRGWGCPDYHQLWLTHRRTSYWLVLPGRKPEDGRRRQHPRDDCRHQGHKHWPQVAIESCAAALSSGDRLAVNRSSAGGTNVGTHRHFSNCLGISIRSGGRGGIRTHERVAPLPVFKTGALNHSATLPRRRFKHLARTPTEQKWKIGTRMAPLAPYAFSVALMAADALASSLRNRSA